MRIVLLKEKNCSPHHLAIFPYKVWKYNNRNFKNNGIDGLEESVDAADYAIAIAKRHNAELIAVNVLTLI
jgi:hypothetical protein